MRVIRWESVEEEGKGRGESGKGSEKVLKRQEWRGNRKARREMLNRKRGRIGDKI